MNEYSSLGTGEWSIYGKTLVCYVEKHSFTTRHQVDWAGEGFLCPCQSVKWKGGFLKLEILRQTAVQDAVVLGKPDWSGCCCTSVSFLWDPHQVAAELVLWEVRQLCQEEAAEHPPLSCEPFFFFASLGTFWVKILKKTKKKVQLVCYL